MAIKRVLTAEEQELADQLKTGEVRFYFVDLTPDQPQQKTTVVEVGPTGKVGWIGEEKYDTAEEFIAKGFRLAARAVPEAGESVPAPP